MYGYFFFSTRKLLLALLLEVIKMVRKKRIPKEKRGGNVKLKKILNKLFNCPYYEQCKKEYHITGSWECDVWEMFKEPCDEMERSYG